MARLPRNAFLVFGWTADRDLDRACAMTAGSATAIAGNRLNDPNTLRYCDQFGEMFQNLGSVSSPPFQNEFKANAAIPIRWGFIGSMSFYSNRYQASYSANPFAASLAGGLNNGYLPRTWTLSASSVYPANCVGCTPGTRVFPTGFVLGQGPETINLVAPGQVLSPRLNQLDLGIKKAFTFKDRFRVEPEVQVFNVLNSNAAVAQATSLGANAAPYLPQSACTGAAGPTCGLGGPVTVITNPRLLRVALLVKF